jgi:hypothetical protein
MALWSLSTADVRELPPSQLSVLFAYLGLPRVVQQLTRRPVGGGSSSTSTVSSTFKAGSDSQQQQQQQQQQTEALAEMARGCGTIVWAAAKLGFRQHPAPLKPYLEAFLWALHSIPVPCSSITTVLLAVGSILAQQSQQLQLQHHQQQQQQQQQQVRDATQPAARQQQQQQQLDDDRAFWQSRFLLAGREAVKRLQQQVAAAAADGGRAASSLAAAGVSQIMWAYQEAGLTPAEDQLAAMLQLTGELVSTAAGSVLLLCWWLRAALGAVAAPAAACACLLC